MTQRTINIKDTYGFKALPGDADFILIIDNEKYKIRIHLERWEMKWLVDELWKVIRYEEQEVTKMKQALMGVKL